MLPSLSDPAKRLHELGFLNLSTPDGAEFVITDNEFRAAVWQYQIFHGLVADGVLGPVTREHMERPRICGHPDVMHMEAASSRRWPTNDLTYGFENLSDWPFGQGETRDIFAWVFNNWSAVSQLTFKLVNVKSAHIRIQYKYIDGPGKTLAQAYLADGTLNPKWMQVDSGERKWVFSSNPASGTIDAGAVIDHEAGHNLGLGHEKGRGDALMDPIYNPKIRTPQSRDIASLHALGYEPPLKPPTVPGGGGGSEPEWLVELRGRGTITDARIPGFRVTQLLTS